MYCHAVRVNIIIGVSAFKWRYDECAFLLITLLETERMRGPSVHLEA